MDKQNLLHLLQTRSTCKQYDPARTVSDDDFAFLLEAARLSPSSFGFEPWRFVVVQSPELRQLIGTHAWGAKDKIGACSHFVLILARLANTLHADAPYIMHMMQNVHGIAREAAEARRERYRTFCEQDFALYPHEPRSFYDWACKQCYIALGNMLTAAQAAGIDATAVEGFPLETLNRALAERGVYDGGTFKLAVMAAFGYRADPPRPKTRQSLDDIVAWV
ncbi:NAD(P)H-dependent oxidoreductase [Conchiformibius kuhniae]|uniref:NAD(P)H-dependent oxidoreductase n=1 Tax=Conchiformibius kuhniae TaxID=211502 RepID=A0A8T9MWJ1_9NEIS|nr:NAD(P)H-dependent oxidoreductase [Conchiformibius kuhniae]UOP04263.1 NAD(P)H-dependent oxidoreductase [Conchiformibius kuhniae]